ncbi:type II toxin-antitoxin system RelE/ParE family toxin [Legionella pneumophila serogroup 1]|uniref:type II toxin-antitoxin system RelE/ParE family toxin n=1 Tax=Legionella pneumophila TaxID=446 RepID=UPI0007785D0D|nr:type II toxin-antitoxin system RelE/ParE family toxin [Legionella pneumophila]HAT8623319.1 type II toxin-antitoxin system RelE/ParE family toxin [Legionella pneumophila]HAU1410294.1 type II toxin-antitoxin system RelE/ParE family toxin [Legionella pneumophila]HCC3170274.1 type II toxin-antitoxin system RelE/ParE family toxin [Legionella pneumophila]HCC3179504.1 type II toxin-antitoxin system RelE/ParE family toxin [Legionella pneumophila]HCC3185454.1 type II toxin-antitoxin system RelE/ParE
MIMNLIVKQSNSFKRTIKKLPKQQKILLDEEIKKLIKNPTLGECKKGDLDFLRVHKFKFSNQEILLGYVYEENELILTLLILGVHENFYRDIKK